VSISRREWERAEVYCSMCLELSRGDWRHLYNLAMVYVLSGNLEEARKLRTQLSRLEGVNYERLLLKRSIAGG